MAASGSHEAATSLVRSFHMSERTKDDVAEGTLNDALVKHPLLTRKQAVELIRAELGVPLGLSKIEKDAMDGRGPKPRARYGRHFLYDRDDVLAYGRSLIE